MSTTRTTATRLAAILLAGPLLAVACAGSEDGDDLPAQGRAEVSVSVVDEADADANGDQAGQATGEAVRDEATGEAVGGPAAVNGPASGASQSGQASDGSLLDLSRPLDVSDRIEIASDSIGYTFDAATVPSGKVSVEINATGENGCADDPWDLELSVVDSRGEEMDGEGSPRVGSYGCAAYGPWTLAGEGPYTILFTSSDTLDEGQGYYEATLAVVG